MARCARLLHEGDAHAETSSVGSVTGAFWPHRSGNDAPRVVCAAGSGRAHALRGGHSTSMPFCVPGLGP
eukprot:1010578-Pyramimonas_sp.AAC.1